MAEIIRNRTIRPSTRQEQSKSYKIDTKQVTKHDTLIVNIDHESKPIRKRYKFRGIDVAHKNSISFRVLEDGSRINISWSGAQPIGSTSTTRNPVNKKTKSQAIREKKKSLKTKKVVSKKPIDHLKTSFAPIANSNTEVLILGTLPSDTSIELNEYYANPRNRFWKVITTITKSELPTNYNDKKKILITNKIGIWDVAHQAVRKGSLDSNIKDEIPNDLDGFIKKYRNLKIVGFNGTKAEALFNKYFTRNPKIRYISLPSTSSANTGISLEDTYKRWKRVLMR